MAVERPAARERRSAIWPWLVMPLVVLLVFWALFRIHHQGVPWAAPWNHAASGSP